MSFSWTVLVIIGASLNAFNNLGYKMLSAGDSIFLFTANLFLIASIVWFSVGYIKNKRIPPEFLTFPVFRLTLLLGGLTAAIMILFIRAFQSGGPVSLVDPLLACVYSLMSVAIGVYIMRERPSIIAYAGIVAYLAGAALMIFG